ncbi:hypothetical protein ELQ15_08755 [Campylobacter sp. US12a]|uniref:DUF4354 family protein n=1 Tax=Campylobacter sp. US12a TaxID=2498116 RepID=UPI001067E2B2|nr:DUF4354 family protein [Campylobacter sp. US12a]TEY03860.1 hypothetical protein ELQ15_08755 [Campylobacter sp. US12a]
MKKFLILRIVNHETNVDENIINKDNIFKISVDIFEASKEKDQGILSISILEKTEHEFSLNLKNFSKINIDLSKKCILDYIATELNENAFCLEISQKTISKYLNV